MATQLQPPADTYFTIQIIRHDNTTIRLLGNWRAGARADPKQLQQRLNALRQSSDHAAHWDLTAITEIDSLALSMLWQVWQQKIPTHLRATPTQLAQIQEMSLSDKTVASCRPLYLVHYVKRTLIQIIVGVMVLLGQIVLAAFRHSKDMFVLLGQSVNDCVMFIKRPQRIPFKEISAAIFKTGAQALGITALVGFLIGIVLSYLSAQQLKQFGANALIVNLLGISITRELGPVLAAILIAGRSGSSMTAQLGVMRVTEEIDAMRVMGISVSQRLIFPKLIALTFVMPLLSTWVCVIALMGGALAANLELGLPISFFIKKLPQVVGMFHLWIGLFKSLVFGLSIALVACHFGLRIQPNTDSLGRGTTQSVVTAITVVILLDALFAILFKSLV